MAINQVLGNELIKTDIFAKVDLKEGMYVGDLGCGNLGYVSIPAAKIVGANGLVYAVDILKSALESVAGRARQAGLNNIKTVWSNLEIIGATKVPAETLDVIFIVNVLFQSDKDAEIIRESHRLLKTGGKLVVVDWDQVSAPFGPPMADRAKKEDIKQFGQAAGFQFQEEFQAGQYHYGLVLVK